MNGRCTANYYSVAVISIVNIMQSLPYRFCLSHLLETLTLSCGQERLQRLAGTLYSSALKGIIMAPFSTVLCQASSSREVTQLAQGKEENPFMASLSE